MRLSRSGILHVKNYSYSPRHINNLDKVYVHIPLMALANDFSHAYILISLIQFKISFIMHTCKVNQQKLKKLNTQVICEIPTAYFSLGKPVGSFNNDHRDDEDD